MSVIKLKINKIFKVFLAFFLSITLIYNTTASPEPVYAVGADVFTLSQIAGTIAGAAGAGSVAGAALAPFIPYAIAAVALGGTAYYAYENVDQIKAAAIWMYKKFDLGKMYDWKSSGLELTTDNLGRMEYALREAISNMPPEIVLATGAVGTISGRSLPALRGLKRDFNDILPGQDEVIPDFGKSGAAYYALLDPFANKIYYELGYFDEIANRDEWTYENSRPIDLIGYSLYTGSYFDPDKHLDHIQFEGRHVPDFHSYKGNKSMSYVYDIDAGVLSRSPAGRMFQFSYEGKSVSEDTYRLDIFGPVIGGLIAAYGSREKFKEEAVLEKGSVYEAYASGTLNVPMPEVDDSLTKEDIASIVTGALQDFGFTKEDGTVKTGSATVDINKEIDANSVDKDIVKSLIGSITITGSFFERTIFKFFSSLLPNSLTSSWDAVKKVADGKPVAPPVVKINMHDIMSSVSSEVGSYFPDKESVFVDFGIMNRFKFMGVSLITFFRGTLSSTMVISTMITVYQRLAGYETADMMYKKRKEERSGKNNKGGE